MMVMTIIIFALMVMVMAIICKVMVVMSGHEYYLVIVNYFLDTIITLSKDPLFANIHCLKLF